VMPDLSAALMRSVRADSGKASSSTPIISASAARAAMCTAVLKGTATVCSTGHSVASSKAAADQHAACLKRCRELYRVFMGGRAVPQATPLGPICAGWARFRTPPQS